MAMIDPARIDLADIVNPLPPPGGTHILLFALALVLTLAALAGWIWYRLRSRRARARRRLRRLARHVRQGRLEPREAAFKLAQELRYALVVRNLADGSEPPGGPARGPEARHRWQRFTAQLTRHRYARGAANVDDTVAAIVEARRWLRPW